MRRVECDCQALGEHHSQVLHLASIKLMSLTIFEVMREQGDTVEAPETESSLGREVVF
jgi:hypothetical protein